MGYDLFLAHASPDKATAEQLYDALGALGVRAFLDARSIDPGERWDRVIPRAQRESLATIVLVTSRYDEAYYLGDEIASAIARAREAPDAHRVIPALLDGMPSDAFGLPYGLRVVNGLDVPKLGGIQGLAARLHDLVVKWRGTASGTPPTPASPPTTPSPRCAPMELHERLCKLLDVQFETLVLYAGLHRADIAGPTAPLSRRALDVVGMVQQGGAPVCERVCTALKKVAPSLA